MEEKSFGKIESMQEELAVGKFSDTAASWKTSKKLYRKTKTEG